MFFEFIGTEGSGGNGAKVYQCMTCGGLITHSDQLLTIRGSNRHLFVNPAGMECDFHTFSYCPGAIAIGEDTEAHTWFPGFSWRFALCRQCGQHIGWYYEAVTKSHRPLGFWGILLSHTISG